LLAAELERADPLAVWRKRWIWMLAGYLGLNTASILIHYVRKIVEWLARDQSQIFVMCVSVATLFVCLALVILIARRVSRTWSLSRESKWSMAFEKPVGFAGLAIVFVVLLSGSLYGGILLDMNLPWREDQTRLEWGTTFMWTLAVFTAFVPVAALCALLWSKVREAQDETRPDLVQT
jgi:hypothetical protein